ncbi:MAG: BlaI/MecI/CopY family transcriptional regulator [Pirellulaceae bacterium]|nr:BlaI/MecI/CopY family transcriptional regulator [Pirellulaceae bacterium]
MVDQSSLSRRERQIMDILFAKGEATVRQIQETLEDPPTVMAVRRMLHILEEKGYLKRHQAGREVVYSPLESRKQAGASALKHVIDTFFSGAIDEALAAHFARKEDISPDQLARLQAMIAEAKQRKPKSDKK